MTNTFEAARDLVRAAGAIFDDYEAETVAARQRAESRLAALGLSIGLSGVSVAAALPEAPARSVADYLAAKGDQIEDPAPVLTAPVQISGVTTFPDGTIIETKGPGPIDPPVNPLADVPASPAAPADASTPALVPAQKSAYTPPSNQCVDCGKPCKGEYCGPHGRRAAAKKLKAAGAAPAARTRREIPPAREIPVAPAPAPIVETPAPPAPAPAPVPAPSATAREIPVPAAATPAVSDIIETPKQDPIVERTVPIPPIVPPSDSAAAPDEAPPALPEGVPVITVEPYQLTKKQADHDLPGIRSKGMNNRKAQDQGWFHVAYVDDGKYLGLAPIYTREIDGNPEHVSAQFVETCHVRNGLWWSGKKCIGRVQARPATTERKELLA